MKPKGQFFTRCRKINAINRKDETILKRVLKSNFINKNEKIFQDHQIILRKQKTEIEFLKNSILSRDKKIIRLENEKQKQKTEMEFLKNSILTKDKKIIRLENENLAAKTSFTIRQAII